MCVAFISDELFFAADFSYTCVLVLRLCLFVLIDISVAADFLHLRTGLGTVFVPLFLLEAIAILELPSACSSSSFEAAKQARGGFVYKTRLEFALDQGIAHLLRIIQWILLAMKNDNERFGATTSWWTTMCPVWLAFVWAALKLSLRCARVRGGAEERNRPADATQEDSDMRDFDSVGNVFGQACISAPVLIFFILLAVRLSGSEEGEVLPGLSMGVVLSPLFTVIGLMFCAVCLCVW